MKIPTRNLLNVGCGHQRPPDWINTDCSLNAVIQRFPLFGKQLARLFKATEYASDQVRYVNLTKRWPFPDSSIDVVYGSHVFEHLSLSQSRNFLRESLRVLKPGGTLRLVVPDLYQAAKSYVADCERGIGKASENFLFTLNLHLENTYPFAKNRAYKLVHSTQGWPHQHKYMYDAPSLKALMEEFGFKSTQEFTYGVSGLISEICDVENTAEGIPSVYLECTRP